MVSTSIYSYSQLISLLQYTNYNREIPFNKYMGNLILEQNLFGLMMDIICKEKGNISFRAAWAVEYAFLKQPDSFLNFVPQFITYFHKTENESVRRLYGKIMYILLSKKWLVTDIDTAESIAETVCQWLTSPKAKIGNKIWCLNILQILNSQVEWITEVMENIIAKESVSPTPGMKCFIRKLRQCHYSKNTLQNSPI